MGYFDEEEDDPTSPILAPPRAVMPIGTSVPPVQDAQQAPTLGMATKPAGPAPIGQSVQQPSDADKRLAGDQAKYQHILDSGSGVDQFGQHHNKFLSGLAHVADAVGGAMFPTIAMNIPGTSLHHSLLLGQSRNAVNEDQAQQFKAAQLADEQSKPDIAQARIDALTAQNNAKDQHQKDQTEAVLHQHGFKHDETGQIVPLSYQEMSEQQQAVHDLKASQDELTQATKAYKDAQTKNVPVAMEMAKQRMATAQQNAATARGRLGLQQDEFDANYLGTHNGEALPGGTTDAQGNPVGVRVANTNTTSSDRLKRSDLAQNVLENTGALRTLIQGNPNLFGKIAGRYTTVQQMIGSDDPSIAQIGVRIHNAALASNGAHGLRSQEAIAETENMLLNHFRNSPKATGAALDALDDSVKTFIHAAKQGKRPDSGSDVEEYKRDPKTGRLVKQ